MTNTDNMLPAGVRVKAVFAQGPNPNASTNPIDAQLQTESDVARFWRSVSGDYTWLAQTAYTHLGMVDEAWRAEMNGILMDETRTSEWRSQQLDKIRTAALEKIGEVLAEAGKRMASVEQGVAKALEPAPSKDVSADLIARDGAWRRLQMRLEAASKPDQSATSAFSALMSIVGQASRDGDTATIAAARYYAPAFLATLSGPSLDDEQVGQAIDAAIAPSLSALAKAALQVRQALRYGFPRLTSAIQMCRTMAANGQSGLRVTEVPGFDGGQVRISQFGV